MLTFSYSTRRALSLCPGCSPIKRRSVLRDEMRISLVPIALEELDEVVYRIKAEIFGQEFQTLWQEGPEMSVDDLVRLALKVDVG